MKRYRRSPNGDAAVFATFGANSGEMQNFTGGVIIRDRRTAQRQVLLLGGLVLSIYNAAGALPGAFGMPTSDEFGVAGGTPAEFRRRNHFLYARCDLCANSDGA